MEQNTFITRIAKRIEGHSGPVLFIAGSEWGAPYLFEGFTEQELAVWLRLGPTDEGDPVAQGNKFADAMSRALGSPLFGHAMPFNYGLAVLKEHQALFEPLSLILSGADFGQDFASELVKLQSPGCRVILEFADLPVSFLIPDDALVLTPSDLKLAKDEVLELGLGRLSETELVNLQRLTGGCYERFLLELHKRLSLPAKLRPGPDKSELPPGAEVSLQPETLLAVFSRREQWLEALELAAQSLPERVPELITKAGPAYLAKGLYQRLSQLLAQLPAGLKDHERILPWRLRAAWRLGQVETLRPVVENHLASHEAPDLRALYATFLTAHPESLRQVERAYQAAQTPLTLRHYAIHILYEKPEKALELFHRYHSMVPKDNLLERAEVMASIGVPLIHLGRYREAATWFEESLATFDKQGGGDWQFRMHTSCNWAYMRVLLGETVGLAELLKNEERALRDAFPTLAIAYRSTLGDYLRSQNQPHEALYYYEKNLQFFTETNPTQGTNFPMHIVKDVVQCLLHMADFDKAAALARKHYYLTRTATPAIRAYASLAQGMALTFLTPADALEPLHEALELFEERLQGPFLASASLFLARAYLELGEEKQARACLERARLGLRELSDSGFRLLAGPEEHFRQVWSLWRGNEIPLSLKFLGANEVILDNEVQDFYPQWCEVIALLALHPDGLGSEELLLELYGDGGNLSTLKSTLSKIRSQIPLTRPPYRLDIPFEADFMQIERCLKEGRIRAALELYKGPLLPKSEAPAIVEAREVLEESLRQAVLESGDAEALLNLAERIKDDPELWEAAIDALPQQDPRHSLANAKHKKLLEAWGID